MAHSQGESVATQVRQATHAVDAHSLQRTTSQELARQGALPAAVQQPISKCKSEAVIARADAMLLRAGPGSVPFDSQRRIPDLASAGPVPVAAWARESPVPMLQ